MANSASWERATEILTHLQSKHLSLINQMVDYDGHGMRRGPIGEKSYSSIAQIYWEIDREHKAIKATKKRFEELIERKKAGKLDKELPPTEEQLMGRIEAAYMDASKHWDMGPIY